MNSVYIEILWVLWVCYKNTNNWKAFDQIKHHKEFKENNFNMFFHSGETILAKVCAFLFKSQCCSHNQMHLELRG